MEVKNRLRIAVGAVLVMAAAAVTLSRRAPVDSASDSGVDIGVSRDSSEDTAGEEPIQRFVSATEDEPELHYGQQMELVRAMTSRFKACMLDGGEHYCELFFQNSLNCIAWDERTPSINAGFEVFPEGGGKYIITIGMDDEEEEFGLGDYDLVADDVCDEVKDRFAGGLSGGNTVLYDAWSSLREHTMELIDVLSLEFGVEAVSYDRSKDPFVVEVNGYRIFVSWYGDNPSSGYINYNIYELTGGHPHIVDSSMNSLEDKDFGFILCAVGGECD